MVNTRKPDSTSGQQQLGEESFNDGSVEWLYDVALDPLRMETLVDEWERAIAELRSNADFQAPELLNDLHILRHFERAQSILSRVDSNSTIDQIDLVLSQFKSVPAFVVDAALKIRAVNDVAAVSLGLGTDSRINSLPLQSADFDQLLRTVRRLLAEDREDIAIHSFRPTNSDQITVFRLQLFHLSDRQPMILLAANAITWPSGLSATLMQVFGLTPAETDVLRSFIESGSINDVSNARVRSVDTIRGQIKSIMAKTETHSQVELARLTMSIMEVAGVQPEHEKETKNIHRGYATLEDREFRTIVMPDGRKVDYLVLGDPKGRPLLYLSGALGLIRWPARAEAEAVRRGLRIIVPLRPGYGGSDPVGADVDFDWALITDSVSTLDAENVEMCPILSMEDDSYYAFEIARAYPQRVRALIATAGVLPLTHSEQFERMQKWQRFMLAGAKYTPHLIPFMARAASYMTQKIGKRRFLGAVFGQSPGDVATFEDPEVFEALSCGSEVMMSEHRAAYTSFSRQLTGRKKDDWSATVNALRDKVPVIFMNGDEDPQVHLETLAEFRQDHPWIDFRIFPGSGHLLFFQHWGEVLDVIQPYVGNEVP